MTEVSPIHMLVLDLLVDLACVLSVLTVSVNVYCSEKADVKDEIPRVAQTARKEEQKLV